MTSRQQLLLVASGRDPLHFEECRLTLWDRLAARIRAWSLDAELAAGAPVESSAARAARAQALVDPERRAALAGHWARLIASAEEPPPAGGRIALPRPCYDRVRAARPELEQMIALLDSPQPVPARGVALASQLLTDGTGPVHNRANRTDLAAAALATIARLDPAAGLLRAG